MPSIQIESPRSDDVRSLLRQGDAFALALYPAENYHGLDVDALEADGVSLFVAREHDVAVGTAAIVDRRDGSGEIKRMFVTDDARGLGVGRALLQALEAHARDVGISTLQLETGLPQVAAIALYEKLGYRQVPRFAPYTDDPTSYCMESTSEAPPVIPPWGAVRSPQPVRRRDSRRPPGRLRPTAVGPGRRPGRRHRRVPTRRARAS